MAASVVGGGGASLGLRKPPAASSSLSAPVFLNSSICARQGTAGPQHAGRRGPVQHSLRPLGATDAVPSTEPLCPGPQPRHSPAHPKPAAGWLPAAKRWRAPAHARMRQQACMGAGSPLSIASVVHGTCLTPAHQSHGALAHAGDALHVCAAGDLLRVLCDDARRLAECPHLEHVVACTPHARLGVCAHACLPARLWPAMMRCMRQQHAAA